MDIPSVGVYIASCCMSVHIVRSSHRIKPQSNAIEVGAWFAALTIIAIAGCFASLRSSSGPNAIGTAGATWLALSIGLINGLLSTNYLNKSYEHLVGESHKSDLFWMNWEWRQSNHNVLNLRLLREELRKDVQSSSNLFYIAPLGAIVSGSAFAVGSFLSGQNYCHMLIEGAQWCMFANASFLLMNSIFWTIILR